MEGAAATRAVDLLVLQDCLSRLKPVPTPFGVAMDVGGILVSLRKRSTSLSADELKLLDDVLALAVARAEGAAPAQAQPEPEPEPEVVAWPRAQTPPPRPGTPPGRARQPAASSPPVESPVRPTVPGGGRRGNELRVASWNMKHLSDATVFADGATKDLAKIVQILRKFDFVAIQEITNSQLTLETLCKDLPGRWAFAVSPKFQQLNDRQSPECLAFLWRADRVTCTGPVDEDGKPTGYLVTESGTQTPAVHYWHRPPFFSSFKAAELEFLAMTCHVTFSGAPNTAQREAFERPANSSAESDAAGAVQARRVQPQRGGQAMDKLDGRRLEVENLAAASVLLREQLARSRPQTAGAIQPTLLVLADFNLDMDDEAFGVMERAGLRPLVNAAGGTMVRSAHTYDNIFSSSYAASVGQVGSSVRSGAVDLAAVMNDAAATLAREKSARSAAFDHVSDHKPVFVDLCCGAADDSLSGAPASTGWRLAPIRMSRVGDIGRTYTTSSQLA